jgi:hypothetical protein
LAKCTLDIDEPKITFQGNASEEALKEGLATLRNRIAENHKLSNWFNHPMTGFPDYYNKVWEWDFKPTGERSSTRPGWRVLAYIPNPNGPEPILARPFIAWDKSEAPKKNQQVFIADALKKFLAETIKIGVEEEVFHHTVDGQGRHIAMCLKCWEHVEAFELDELDLLKDSHKEECVGHPPF